MNWWQTLLAVIAWGAWTLFCVVCGAGIMKSSYSPPNDTRSLGE